MIHNQTFHEEYHSSYLQEEKKLFIQFKLKIWQIWQTDFDKAIK